MTILSRREALGTGLALLGGCAAQRPRGGPFRIATFSADVTPPIGHPLLAGLCPPAAEIADPLFAKGFALFGAEKPLVVCCVDWCEIRNEAHDRWRAALAEAAGTTPDRVLVSSVHQHDAPLADLEADRILRDRGLPDRITDPDFHERAVRGTAARAVRSAGISPIASGLGRTRRRTEHVGGLLAARHAHQPAQPRDRRPPLADQPSQRQQARQEILDQGVVHGVEQRLDPREQALQRGHVDSGRRWPCACLSPHCTSAAGSPSPGRSPTPA